MTNSNNYLSSPARTPSSENKSFDSALSSGIVSDISSTPNPSASSEYSEFSSDMEASLNRSLENRIAETDDATPVNTIQRHHNASSTSDNSLRRSVSRSSKSSSPETASTSSGCLSDRGSSSSGSGNQPFIPNGVSQEANKSKLQQQLSNAGGFDTDYHVGGTIKKRPPVLSSSSTISNPRIPLTNTTWGLVTRDSDEDEISSITNSADSISDGGSGRGNIRIGGGGTLLRCSTALRKNSLNNNASQNVATNGQTKVSGPEYGRFELPSRAMENDAYKESVETLSNYSDQSSINLNHQSNIIQAQVHNNPNQNTFDSKAEVDVISEEFENRLRGLSVEPQMYSRTQTTAMKRDAHEEDDIPLPPPPREESLVRVTGSSQCVPHPNLEDVDDLPPPPPPEIYEQLQSHNQMNGVNKGSILGAKVQFYEQPNNINFQQKQSAIKNQLPQTLPPSSLKSSQVISSHD